MNSRHFWFRSGNYSLPGHLDVPRQRQGKLGIVIVPPFGWEDVCAYRPLRFMAQKFCQHGIPTLRYDLPGTGDSSGDARDAGLFDAWIQSVADAAGELRRATGVEDVAAVGIHMGALIALVAEARGADLRYLVLWGVPSRGRAIVREMRAAANMERWEHLAEQDAPPQPIPGLEASGFLISPETMAALESLDIAALPKSRCERMLLLSRDELPHDSRLAEALQAPGTTVTRAHGAGYSAMMNSPQESVNSEVTCNLIVNFLNEDVVPLKPFDTNSFSLLPPVPARELVSDHVLESICPIEAWTLGMFGIFAEPTEEIPRSDYCILYLNPGGVRHTGPNRMWVESARRWAAEGIPSLRLDLNGIGESEGEQFIDVPGLYQNRMVDQIEVAIDSLQRRAGVKKFIAVGLCSGACWAYHVAMRNPDVHAAILMNPSLLNWDPGADRRRILRPLATGFTAWANWTRMIRSGIRRGDFHAAIRRVAERLGRSRSDAGGYLHQGFKSLDQAWAAFERNRKRVTLVFREGEPLLAEMEAAGEVPSAANSFVRCIRVPNGGHTLRPLWAQQLVHELIDGAVGKVVRPVQWSSVANQQTDESVPTRTLHA